MRDYAPFLTQFSLSLISFNYFCPVVRESTYSELKNAVMVIHTKNNGEISESSTGKNQDELKQLRKQSNEIDNWDSPFKAIVSVLMLKEGWDVKNVTTIVGLRAYTSKSNILPEQTLGRGLRRMYRGEDFSEYVSVIGTEAFMDFVESIKSEGVELERSSMGEGVTPKTPLIIEPDLENKRKDLDKLDIEIPILTPRIYREYKNLSELNLNGFTHKKVSIKQFSEEEKREIVFRDITSDKITHRTELDSDLIPDYQSVVGYFTKLIMEELRLVGGYDVLYEKIKLFIQRYLFEKEVEINDLNILRNLSEIDSRRIIIEAFKKNINQLTILDKGQSEIRDYIRIGKSRPFVVKEQGYLVPKKSIFNKIVGDSHLELLFAEFLENCEDLISYIKNYLGIHFKIDYINYQGDISNCIIWLPSNQVLRSSLTN